MPRPKYYADTELSEVISYSQLMAKRIKLQSGTITTVEQATDADFRAWINMMLDKIQTSGYQTAYNSIRKEMRAERMDVYARYYFVNEVERLNRSGRVALFVQEEKAS
jgi:hypothetical protein